MKSLLRALVVIGVAGVAFGLIDLVVTLTSDHAEVPWLSIAIVLTVGWSFIGTGLFAWWRRPNNRLGAQMTALGFSWFIGPLALSDIPAVFAVGLMLNSLAPALLVHLLLSFPSGRLETRSDRVLTAAAYVVAVGMQIAASVFQQTFREEHWCKGCPDNPLVIYDSPSVYSFLTDVQSIAGVVILVALVVVLIRRWRRMSPSVRPALTPVLATGSLTLGLLGLQLSETVAGAPDSVVDVTNLASIFSLALVPFAFLFGLLRSRFSRAGAVSELIAALSESPGREIDIRDALADALGDPTLEFAYWLPERDHYVNSKGSSIELPVKGSQRSWSAVEHDGELVAAIIYDRSLDDEQQLIRATGAAAALVLENKRLEAELRANLEELRASRARIVEAADDERRRLERDLHDGAQQHLVSLALNLRMVRSQIENDPRAAAELLDESMADVTAATDELRELARGIHPAVLTDRGLEAAIGALANRATIPVEIIDVPAERLPSPVEAAAYFVVSEALTNVARYASASSASVTIQRSNGLATVQVSDDGVGGADAAAGSGLRGLADRVASLDGHLKIVSESGRGTTITAEIPCA